VVAARHEVFICDATVAEYIAGKPWTDSGQQQRWQNYWDSFFGRFLVQRGIGFACLDGCKDCAMPGT